MGAGWRASKGGWRKMTAQYPGPSPAAVVGVGGSEAWTLDIFEYRSDFGNERTFQLAVFVELAPGQWVAGKGLFNCPLYTRGTVINPDGTVDNLSFQELIAATADWAARVAGYIPMVNAWLAARYGGAGPVPPTPDDAAATAARQAIATAIYGYKVGVDGISVVPK